MLGTNDLKAQFGRAPERIAQGADKLVHMIQVINCGVGTTHQSPKVLRVAPPPLGTNMASCKVVFDGGLAKSQQPGEAYAAVARTDGEAFPDAGSAVRTDGVDDLRLSAASEQALGRAIARKVREMTR